eukprot:CAMPEP_0114557588 /NCGR_PEP_ID=MMETSP0114-20121206/9915_1 /TAXON_ID=31324 /ORGANISM="Goniomonas sp, Strain m" /LENGTH=438 /DNA_ID=CAMNT_0001742895 /DNA_START=16 /DNA_END=1332 /DNA_ORIENTATION=+
MVQITETMLRKKAEHNEGCLSTLEELTLHQMNIEGINKAFIHCCPNLQIVYLQNNLIGRIENLRRLRSLKYLNLAVNNIKKIEGLERNENLEKLDFTVNFIDLQGLMTLPRLKCNFNLRELYMVGNPCTQWPHYRAYVLATLPQLKKLDGKEVTASERIQALQELEAMKAELKIAATREAAEAGVVFEEPNMGEEEESDSDDDTATVKDKSGAKSKWSIESRHRDYQKQLKKEQKEEEEKKEAERRRDPLWADKERAKQRRAEEEASGVYRQRNEGKWAFDIAETGTTVTVSIGFPKFMDTSLIDIDVQPLHVKCVAKGKTIVLAVPSEVRPDAATAARSMATGALVLTLSKMHPTEAPTTAPCPTPKVVEPSPDKKQLAGAVDFRHIAKPSEALKPSDIQSQEEVAAAAAKANAEQLKQQETESPTFEDDPEVPPLE